MKTYNELLNEGYFRQNLYHFTSEIPLESILIENKINVSYYDNIFKDELIKFVSLTRNKDYVLSFRTTNIRIELDRDLLSTNFKIIPYDFFIHKKEEKLPKWNILRKSPYEYEEIILSEINNLHKYIVSIKFDNIYTYYKNLNRINNYLEINNININLIY